MAFKLATPGCAESPKKEHLWMIGTHFYRAMQLC